MAKETIAKIKSGYVAIIGRPNVGKSTLVNRLTGERIAIVSAKPQTTRHLQLGIYNDANHQIIFIDTPGIYRPKLTLGKKMVASTIRALKDADLVLWLTDITANPTRADEQIIHILEEKKSKQPIILVLNKADLISKQVRSKKCDYLGLITPDFQFMVSALHGQGVPELLCTLCKLVPYGPRYFPVDQVSDANMRFTAAEIIREKILMLCEYEVPHATAVEITSYQEFSKRVDINAVIYVEKESQKGIVIGKGGRMIKQIGQAARLTLEEIVETHIFLDLRVKTRKNWRKDDKFIKRLGYQST